MKKVLISFCIIFLLCTGCTEQPANIEQTPIPTEMPTPVPTEFVPAPLDPAELTEEQWEQMKNTKTCMTPDGAVDLSTYYSPAYSVSFKSYYNNPDSFRRVDYYGTYQGYTAIRLHSTELPRTDKEEVAGCTFYYSGSSNILFCRVLLWKDDTFYQLQYAYDQGLITAEDVQCIAYYNNLRHFEPTVSASPVPEKFPTSMPADFVPAPLEPAELSEDVWTQIQNSYQYVVNGDLFKGPSLEYHRQFSAWLYHGTYKGYIAIFIVDITTFNWYWLWDKIYLWKDDVFYHFQDALNLGLISDQDAKNIIYYHNTIYKK